MIHRLKRTVRAAAYSAGFRIVRRNRNDELLYQGYSSESLRLRRFYNVGAGTFEHRYWTNVDHATAHYRENQRAPFVEFDLMAIQPMNVEDACAELVYTSHTVEHVSDDAVINLFREAFRILKPGGGIRVTTPHAELEYEAYMRRDRTFWYWIDDYSRKGTWEHLYKKPLSEASIEQLFLHHFASQLSPIDVDDSATRKYSDEEVRDILERLPLEEALDTFTRQCRFNEEHPGNHVNWWTKAKARRFLMEAGFKTVRESGYGQSWFPPLRNTDLFDNTHPAISMYVEAVK